MAFKNDWPEIGAVALLLGLYLFNFLWIAGIITLAAYIVKAVFSL